MRTYTQYTLEDYLYKLSIAQIQFLAIDNTHTKYLKGTDKKAWQDYKAAYEAQNRLENFMSSFKVPELKEGEEFEIPYRSNKTISKGKKKNPK